MRIATFFLCAAAVLASVCTGCATHAAAANTVASTIASDVGLGGGQLGQLHVLTGDLDGDLFRALMSIRAGLVQLSTAAAGDAFLTPLVNAEIARFNAVAATVAAEVVHFQALFSVVGAAVNEGVSLQGKPVDWTQLSPVPPVPLTAPAPPAAAPPH